LEINSTKIIEENKFNNNKEVKANDEEKSEKKNDIPNQYLNKSNIIEFNSNSDVNMNMLNNKYHHKNPESIYNNNININNNNLYIINNMYAMNNDKNINNNDSNMVVFTPNDPINNTKSTDGSILNNMDNISGNSQSKDTIRDNIQKRLRMRMMVKDKNYNSAISVNQENNEQLKVINSSQLMPVDSVQKKSMPQDISMNLNDQMNSFQMFMIDNELLDLNTSLNNENDRNLSTENNNNSDSKVEENNNKKIENKNIELKATETEKQLKTDDNKTIENNSEKKETEIKKPEPKDYEKKEPEVKEIENKKYEKKESEINDHENKEYENKEYEKKESKSKEPEKKESDIKGPEIKEIKMKKSTEDSNTDEIKESCKEKIDDDINTVDNISDYINLSPHLGDSMAQSLFFDTTSNNEIISNPDCFINFSYPLNNQLDKKDSLITNNTVQDENKLTQNDDLLYTTNSDWYSNNEDYFSKLTNVNDVNSTLTSDEIKDLWLNQQ